MSLRVSNNNGYTIGYDDGINYADGRVNTNSINYQSGYNSGISYADSRVNESSISYTNGYNSGYNEGSSKVTIDGESVKDKMELSTSAIFSRNATISSNGGADSARTGAVLGQFFYTFPEYSSGNAEIKFSRFYNGGWAFAGSLPTDAISYLRTVVTFNDKIHLLGGYNQYNNTERSHYTFNGTWTRLSDLPIPLYGGAATVYHNELHIFGGYSNSGGSSQQSNKHYKWDESSDTWTFVDTIPFNVDDGGSALVFEDKIFIFEHESSTNYCYKWNEVDGWTQFELPTSYDHRVRRAIEHDDAIYLFGSGNVLHKYNGERWTEVQLVNYIQNSEPSVTFNGKIQWLNANHIHSETPLAYVEDQSVNN